MLSYLPEYIKEDLKDQVTAPVFLRERGRQHTQDYVLIDSYIYDHSQGPHSNEVQCIVKLVLSSRKIIDCDKFIESMLTRYNRKSDYILTGFVDNNDDVWPNLRAYHIKLQSPPSRIDGDKPGEYFAVLNFLFKFDGKETRQWEN